MNKWMMVLGSLVAATSALAQVQPLPPLNGTPGAPGTGAGNSAAASGTGVSGAKWSTAAIGIGSHCSSVILEDTESPDTVWVLPRVFWGMNRFKEKLFDIAPPQSANDLWRLRFAIFVPHNVNDVIGSRGDEHDFFTHGCDFSSVERELQEKAKRKADAEWSARLKEYGMLGQLGRMGHKPDPVKYTLKPILPYKMRVKVGNYGEYWIPSKDDAGQIDTAALQTYGLDHEVTIPFKSEADLKRFVYDFDRDNKHGVKVEVTFYLSAAKKNGSIKCSSHQGSVERSFKGRLAARADFQQLAKSLGGPDNVFAKDPPIDLLKFNLRGELASSTTNKEIQCDMNGSTSDTFNQIANDMAKAVAADLLPNLMSISQQQATSLAGGLPPMLPQSSPFSPLPLGSTGLMACPPGVGTGLPGLPSGGLGSPGIDPTTGQPCDPGGDIDRDKHYVKLSALLSSVKKVADSKVELNLTAPASDQSFTTSFQLIGKLENKAFRKLEVPSSLGPIRVTRTTKQVPGAKNSKGVVETSESVLANGRGTETGVKMTAGRIVRIYPIKRTLQSMPYRTVWKWATWQDITEYTKKGVDFRIQDHSYGWNLSNWGAPVVVFPGGIVDRDNSELQTKMFGYQTDTKFPVFTGHLWNRAFKVVSRPRTVAKSLPIPFTESNLFNLDPNRNRSFSFEGNRIVMNEFFIGFRGADGGKIYSLSNLLKSGDGVLVATTGTDGNGAPYVELNAKADLGEMVLFNMDGHDCTSSIEVDGMRTCQPDWISRIYVEYKGPTSFLVGRGTLAEDDVNSEADPYLRSSDIDAFKQILPKTRSILSFNIDIRTGVESQLKTLLEKKSESIGILPDPVLVDQNPGPGNPLNPSAPSPIAIVPSADGTLPTDQPLILPQVNPKP